MNNIELDSRLKNDCLVLGDLGSSQLLLMNNSLLPWFILVPITAEIELTDLPIAEQETILKEINLISHFIKSNFKVSKLNTATIGNIVSQLHVHVVGRDPTDYCWPNVVWGTKQRTPYTTEQLTEIKAWLNRQIATFKQKEIN